MIQKLLNSLIKINFIKRYKNLCEEYSDYENSISTTNHKQLLAQYKKINKNVKYEPLDRLYTVGFKHNEFNIELCLKLHKGLIQPYFFIEKDGEKLYFHRFDFICRELNSEFGNKHNIPIYTNYDELERILIEIFSIYEDFKKEFLKECR